MTHNASEASSRRRALARRLAAALLGALLYVHGLRPYLPLAEEGAHLAGLAGAFLIAGASYAVLADLSLRGHHRRPNAEVLMVGSLFAFLVLLQAAARPTLAGGVSAELVAGLAGASLLVLLASAAYVARPGLFRDPP